MSFQVTISNVPDKDLGPLLARLPDVVKYDVKHVPRYSASTETPKKKAPKKRGRMLSTTKVMMTGKVPSQPESLLALSLSEFEKLEAKQGIGSVSLQQLTEHLTKKKKMHPSSGKRLIKEKFLEYIV